MNRFLEIRRAGGAKLLANQTPERSIPQQMRLQYWVLKPGMKYSRLIHSQQGLHDDFQLVGASGSKHLTINGTMVTRSMPKVQKIKKDLSQICRTLTALRTCNRKRRYTLPRVDQNQMNVE